jgi:hypothetical protein
MTKSGVDSDMLARLDWPAKPKILSWRWWISIFAIQVLLYKSLKSTIHNVFVAAFHISRHISLQPLTGTKKNHNTTL